MSLFEAREKRRQYATRPEPMRKAGTLGALLDAYVKDLEQRVSASPADTAGEIRRTIPGTRRLIYTRNDLAQVSPAIRSSIS